MTYEEYLDEVTTLITEKYAMTDAAAIKLVIKAQAADFFVEHDDKEAMRTVDRAHRDAKTLYLAAQKK
jgi:intracellular sulfur oxidation DsrE/DsrF family protein